MTALARIEAPATIPVLPRSSVLTNPEQTKINMQAAEYFAKSDLVPAHYRGKPANCFIAINRAQRLGVDELYFMEKTFVIGGRLGMAAELAIELANSSGRFRGPIEFELSGDTMQTRACRAFATLAANGKVVENTVSYAMAQKDGWTKNPKWQSLTDQMLQYRAGAFLIRLYAGGALGGMYMREELEDIHAAKGKLPDDAVSVEPPKTESAPSLPPPEPVQTIDASEVTKVYDTTDAERERAEYDARLLRALAACKTGEELEDLWRMEAWVQAGPGTRQEKIARFAKRRAEIDKPAQHAALAKVPELRGAGRYIQDRDEFERAVLKRLADCREVSEPSKLWDALKKPLQELEAVEKARVEKLWVQMKERERELMPLDDAPDADTVPPIDEEVGRWMDAPA